MSNRSYEVRNINAFRIFSRDDEDDVDGWAFCPIIVGALPPAWGKAPTSMGESTIE